MPVVRRGRETAFRQPASDLLLLPPQPGGFTIAVGQVIETALAQAIAWAPKNRFVGLVAEGDLAQAISRLKTRAVGQVIETDLAQAVIRAGAGVVGRFGAFLRARFPGRI